MEACLVDFIIGKENIYEEVPEIFFIYELRILFLWEDIVKIVKENDTIKYKM